MTHTQKVKSTGTSVVNEATVLPNGLKQTNKVIKIEVNVDDIANKLLETFPEDYKHRVLLTETIIGTAMTKETIGYIYNALNGYTADIDFKVGDKVMCTYQDRRVTTWKNVNEGKSTDEVAMPVKWERTGSKDEEIGECQIVEIDLYSEKKIKVRYMQDTYYNYGETEMADSWTDHRTCTKVPMETELIPVG